MILFPAIDLKDGQCVRLQRGDMAAATVYNSDPAAQAGEFRDIGFSWLHVVDLNGAFAGESRNGGAIDAILHAVSDSMRIQVGGGIRTAREIEGWMLKNVARVILGTAALRDPTSCGVRPARTPAASQSGSTPATARSPWKAGRKPPTWRR
jgi:phosphoribosylformimino-5-aminoimidazole carboxamide ribotide isomerase